MKLLDWCCWRRTVVVVVVVVVVVGCCRTRDEYLDGLFSERTDWTSGWDPTAGQQCGTKPSSATATSSHLVQSAPASPGSSKSSRPNPSTSVGWASVSPPAIRRLSPHPTYPTTPISSSTGTSPSLPPPAPCLPASIIWFIIFYFNSTDRNIGSFPKMWRKGRRWVTKSNSTCPTTVIESFDDGGGAWPRPEKAQDWRFLFLDWIDRRSQDHSQSRSESCLDARRRFTSALGHFRRLRKYQSHPPAWNDPASSTATTTSSPPSTTTTTTTTAAAAAAAAAAASSTDAAGVSEASGGTCGFIFRHGVLRGDAGAGGRRHGRKRVHRVLREERRLRPLLLRPHVPLLRVRHPVVPRDPQRRPGAVPHLPGAHPWRHPRLPLLIPTPTPAPPPPPPLLLLSSFPPSLPPINVDYSGKSHEGGGGAGVKYAPPTELHSPFHSNWICQA